MDDFNVAVAKKCDQYDPTDPAKGQGPIYVQLVLSLALGLSDFFGFCVSLASIFTHRNVLIELDSSAEMEIPICCAQAADRRCNCFTRLARHILWMDTSAVQNYGTASSCICRP